MDVSFVVIGSYVFGEYGEFEKWRLHRPGLHWFWLHDWGRSLGGKHDIILIRAHISKNHKEIYSSRHMPIS